jgi:hypothetical protein
MSILNQMRKSPAMTAAGFLFIVALIVLIGWLITRGSKGAAGPSGGAQGKPQIILNKTQKILHPNKSDVETYIVEYASGDSSAQYIDIKINWSNGGGFKMTEVTTLKFTRKSGDTVIDTITTTDLPDSDKYIKDFESDLSILFKGTDEVDQYLSNGKIPISIMVEYITDGVPQSLAETSIDITESDLDTTLNIDSITTINSLPVLSGDGKFLTELDASSTKTTYSIMFGDGTSIPELQEIRMKVVSDGWIEFYKGVKQVNVLGNDDTTQTYKFVEFGEDSGKYLFLGRFNNTGVGGYLLNTKSINADAATGWGFTGATLAEGLSNIMSDNAVYDRAFVRFIENSPSTTPLPRVYPSQPYPSATVGDTVVNDYNWTVVGADYGNGTYKVKADTSLILIQASDGRWDAEGIFNTGIEAKPEYSAAGGDYEYASVGGGAPSSFYFSLPVYIKLARVDIVPRGYEHVDQSRDEIAEMESKWTIYGVDRSSGSPDETLLYTNDNVTFEKGVIKSLMTTNTGKFNEFKVIMDPVGGRYMVFNELLFYGTDESESASV